MWVRRIWWYFAGYVTIRAEGLSLEKFLNLCAVRGVVLWKIRRHRTYLHACVSVQGFFALHAFMRKLRVRVYIEQKHGAPFWFIKLRKRYMFVPGLVLCVALIWLCTSYVWVVEIEGCKITNPLDLQARLVGYGMKPGVLKSALSPNALENQLMADMREFGFISVSLKGVKLKVKVVEAEKVPDFIDKNTPANMVARKNGVVEKVTPLYGKAMVKAGDTVRQGQILISGKIPQLDGSEYVIHAQGSVIARVWYNEHVEMDIRAAALIRTGKQVACRYIMIWGIRLNISSPAMTFEEYDTKYKEIPLLGKNMLLPARVVTETYYELQPQKDLLDPKVLAQQVGEEKLVKLIQCLPEGVQIVDKNVRLSMIESGIMKIDVTVETREEIAITAKMK